MSGNPCLILEWSEAYAWPNLIGTVKRIPEPRKPAMLQPDRDTAEAEAKRLAAAHPGRKFAVFEACVVGNLPCPTCKEPNRLTPADVRRGYQCDRCADLAEGAW